MQLFLDLDGVLADFDRGVEILTGRRPDQQSTRTMWGALSRAPDFFGTLELMRDAKELWDYCRPHRPRILTGLPLGRWAEAQKRRWVANMLGADVEVITCMSRDKHLWSGPGHVLVDDRAKLKEAWEAKGGTFILHTDAASSIARLKEMGI
ncbi:MAG TPA: hypothetical protein VEB20_04710 [Azospirillaceae bacterium]|nr:hypothetical protein [Azospirillaceae bacterium]